MPENRLIQVNPLVVILFLNKFKTVLNISHQTADPIKTPNTKEDDNIQFVFSCPKPSPAKTAKKVKIVIGLVMVSKKVEVKFFNKPLLSMFASFVAALLINVFIPK